MWTIIDWEIIKVILIIPRLCSYSLFAFFINTAGVATAFATRDILGNVLSGLSVQLSRPFSVGDTIEVCQQSS